MHCQGSRLLSTTSPTIGQDPLVRLPPERLFETIFEGAVTLEANFDRLVSPIVYPSRYRISAVAIVSTLF